MDSDAKRFRAMSGRARRKPVLDPRDEDDAFGNKEVNDLDFRVKERNDEEVLAKKGGKINLFRESSSKSAQKEGTVESIKRPLTGLFRRPFSKAGGRPKDDEDKSAPAPPASSSFTSTRSTPSLMTRPMTGSRNTNTPVSNGPPESRRFTPFMYQNGTKAPTPAVAAPALSSMLQPDSLAAKYPKLMKLDDVDISLLSRFLCTEEEVQDDTEPWTWDFLFATVSSEMREEWAQMDTEVLD